MACEIEKGVPEPPRNKYPFRDMRVGDSFFVNGGGNGDRLRNYSSIWGKRHGRRFSCRKVDGGFRIWRVE